MSEKDYASLRADESAVGAAREVKDDHGETWADVLRFYAERRPDAGTARTWTEPEVRDVARDEAEQVVEEVARR